MSNSAGDNVKLVVVVVVNESLTIKLMYCAKVGLGNVKLF